ncbi:MAG TPA: ACT domain-containing protein [bacterium]|nr:ACT domain-containing protein [bacterium]
MKKLVALSAIGEDKPGIVATLSKVLFENQCNLEDSSMTRLKDDFAVLLLISLPESLPLEKLRQALEPVTRALGLTLSLRELSPAAGAARPSQVLNYTLVVYGLDHPGIVYRVSQCAADSKVNITDLRTHVTQSGDKPLYSLVMELEIPGSQTVGHFQEKLNQLKGELKVDITLNASETDEL